MYDKEWHRQKGRDIVNCKFGVALEALEQLLDEAQRSEATNHGLATNTSSAGSRRSRICRHIRRCPRIAHKDVWVEPKLLAEMQLPPGGEGKVRKIQFLFQPVESIVSDHAVGSQGEQTLTAHGEYFFSEGH
jgi:hypothetical protein